MKDIHRLDVKNSEQNFLSEIEYYFEIAPGVARSILESVKYHFDPEYFHENGLSKNRVPINLVSSNEPAGKPLIKCKLVTVWITLVTKTDFEVYSKFGVTAVRRVRILRYTEEAYDQGALFTHEDLALLLCVSERTIRRDVKEYEAQGIAVPTRGYIKDIGSTVSHKTKAVELLLQGFQPSEVARRMHHSIGSVERYLQSFERIVYLNEKGFSNAEICFSVGISEKLEGEYMKLYNKFKDKGSPILNEIRSDVKINIKKKRGDV